MPAQSIEEWAAPRVQTFPLTALRNAVIGVDALHYLDLRLNTPESIEPLLHATGGHPYSLKASLLDDLEAFQAVDATLVFVFNGIEYRNKDGYTPPKAYISRKAHKDGWKEYYNEDNSKEVAAERTLKAFAKASYPIEKLTRYLQTLLNRHSVPFLVAPYSASAQLAYLERENVLTKQENTQFIDAIIGSSELFLFNVEKIITNFNDPQGSGTFEALSRSACQDRLDKVSDDVFRDVQLLLGGRFLPIFPPLDRAAGAKVNARDALTMLHTAGRSVMQLCGQYRDEQVQGLNYENRYKKAVLCLRHHVVLDNQGRAVFMGPEYEAGDAHEFLGLRLPEELYFYLSRGMLSPHVPSWLTSGEIDLTLPIGWDGSEAYRHLVSSQLTGLQTQTVCLLSDSLNRFYHSRSIKIKMWNSKEAYKSINIKDEPSVKDKIAGWKVPETVLAPNFPGPSSEVNSLAAFNKALNDPKCRQIYSRKEDTSALKTKSEITFNVIGRFLQLRGFVDENHELTIWGKALKKSLGTLDAPEKLEDAVYLALEMLRLGLIDGRTFVPSSNRSKAEEANPAKTQVTKIACLGRLKHRSIGYSGPLDRELLAFQFMINAVRTSLRDIMETILVSMCLNGEIDRNRSDWSDIAFSLPLMNDNGAGLGIAVSTYFDDVRRRAEKKSEAPPTEETKEEVLSNCSWLPRVPNIRRNLRNAFDLWDAVYLGSKEVSSGGKDDAKISGTSAKALGEANTWLSTMR